MIRIYDSLKRSIVPLDPRDAERISMYVCGPTVYNHIHIGNARTFLWFDAIRNYLEYRGYDVTYVMNYTDVDDKIIERARLEGIPVEGVTTKYERAFEDALDALGGHGPDVIVRATQHVEDMVATIEVLIEKDMAYESGGDVYFAVDRLADYGKLSGRSLDDMRAGERVEASELKRHPLDFALWKAAKEEEPSWPSPWGPGRPGWHIECSVMATRYLGMGFDIHGGGSDLMFPHHENEIAQAEAHAGSKPFVRHWLHAGMVQMETEKMSKSLGNVVLAKDVARLYPPEAIRYWVLMGSYRAQAVFSEQALNDAAQAYDRWNTFLDAARHALGPAAPEPTTIRRPTDGEDDSAPPDEYVTRFIDAMDSDFSSPEAFAAIHELVTRGNKLIDGAQRGDEAEAAALADAVASFLEMTGVLGFRFAAAEGESELVGPLVEYLLELREKAREERAFERADEIRDRLAEIGVAVEDTPAGPRWRAGRAPLEA